MKKKKIYLFQKGHEGKFDGKKNLTNFRVDRLHRRRQLFS